MTTDDLIAMFEEYLQGGDPPLLDALRDAKRDDFADMLAVAHVRLTFDKGSLTIHEDWRSYLGLEASWTIEGVYNVSILSQDTGEDDEFDDSRLERFHLHTAKGGDFDECPLTPATALAILALPKDKVIAHPVVAQAIAKLEERE